MNSIPDLQSVLTLAANAAIAAGAILRADFERDTGPRGHGHHADADDEAETVIRDALEPAFPDHGIVGEELRHRDRPAKNGYLWLIDPNDGTKAYLEGHRGSAVSIALLKDGVPILGVVYAYSAPLAGDDLIAGANGLGLFRLRRCTRDAMLHPVTGELAPDSAHRVARQPWSTELHTGCTILVSQHGDHNSVANAKVVGPARFRCVPSVAYRLALAAAGDGEAGVSLAYPGAWDFAAGHALLRITGGELFDMTGTPVTYTIGGGASAGNCIGGAPDICKTLAARDWASVKQRPAINSEWKLVEPKPGVVCRDPGMLSRAQGCLIGQFVGDSLGSLVEFMPADRIRAKYPDGVRYLADGGTWGTIAGQPTDDSELALMLARALVADGTFDINTVSLNYAHWLDSHPFDVGGTTRQALGAMSAALRSGKDPVAAAHASASRSSQANGALMRVSPLGIAGVNVDEAVAADWARQDARLSHPHQVCQDASAVFVVAIRHAILTGESPRAIYDHAVEFAVRDGCEPAILQALRLANEEPPRDFQNQQGWVLIALQNAFYRLVKSVSLETGVVDTVMAGGDTDTNGAIAGALLGAAYGVHAVLPQWLDRVRACRPIEGLSNVDQPRPREFWTVDAVILAELLSDARKQ